MAWPPNPYTLLLFFGGSLSALLALHGWRRRVVAPGLAFAVLMASVALWSIGYAAELEASGLRTKLFWADLQYFGIVGVPATWLVFALENSGRGHRVTRRVLALLAVEPALTVSLVLTSDHHHLFRTLSSLEPTGPYLLLVSGRGPLFWVHAGYSYILLMVGTVLMLDSARSGPRMHRGQSAMVVAAGLVPWLANALYLSGASRLDLSPFAFLATGLLMVGGLSRFGLLDVVPVARETVLEEMRDGVMVLDAAGRVLDANPAAAALFDRPRGDAVGQPLASVAPAGLARAALAPDDSAEIVLGDPPRCFEVRGSALLSGARLVFIHEVTSRRRAEQALRRQGEYLASLHQTALAVMNRLDLEPLLHDLVARAAALLGAPNGFLYLEAPDAAALECRVWIGSRPRDPLVRPNEGAVGRVWKSGAPLAIAAYDDWEGHSPQVPRGIFGSMVVVPLRQGERVVGAIGLAQDHGAERTFDAAEVELLAGFAQLASIALDNARLFAQEHTARERAERLQAATRALSAELEVGSVVDRILTELEGVVPADSASIQELAGTRLRIVGGRGLAASWVGHSFDVAAGDGRSQEVLTREEPVIRGEAPFVDGAFGAGISAGVRSWMGVPLQLGRRVIGVLVLNKREPGFYTSAHANLAWAFATQAAIAMENARLFTAAREELAERTRAQAELERTEARYRDLFEQSLGLICTHDLEGRLLSVNPASAEALGYATEEMVGRNLADFVPAAVRHRFGEYLAAFGKDKTAAGTLQIQTRSGEHRLWRYRNVLRETAAGAHVIGFAQDTTDETKAQAALRESEERFRQLAENIDAVFWMRSFEPDELLYLSPAFDRIWGRSRETMLGDLAAFAETIHADDRAARAAALGRRESFEQEYRIVRPDGSVRWIRARGFPVREASGKIRRMAGVSEDVTELRAAQALREDVTRTMVHDLKNPLTVIRGFVELVTASGALPERQSAMGKTAERAATKLLRLVDSILDVSRLEKGAMPIERTSVAIGGLAAEILELEGVLAEEKSLRLACDAADALPDAWADPELLGRVLQNLVGNAIKFTPRGGDVGVAVALEAGGAALRVSVSDTGPGIPVDLRPRLFQAFATGSQEGRGTGLGLAFCRLAVEAHGGRIWVDEGPKGATIRFTVPIAR